MVVLRGWIQAGRSRVPTHVYPTATLRSKPREPFWPILEVFSLSVVASDVASKSMKSCGLDNARHSEAVLQLFVYPSKLMAAIETERAWVIFSYVLFHLPTRLANKLLFCGPRSKIVFFVGSNSQLTTHRCSPHALALAALELKTSIAAHLLRVMEKFSKITSNPAIVIDCLAIVGSHRALHVSFTKRDYKMMFAIEHKYLENCSGADRLGRAQARGKPKLFRP
ncbi:hypothetical protein TRAPUB_5624 [Trametes pubescens]|uniref:Uncharacterized protein n=1 Tax=Trametes pubescens TaxID=154538 RepID=A0A1M2V7X1_TRAPU|nr:hypothetical protein TRAPUB_5624 [Trametes pubescens]